MSSSGVHRTSTARIARKIEAPRPLKDSSLNEQNCQKSYSPLALSSYSIDCVEKLITLMDMVVNSINQCGDVNANVDCSLLTDNVIHLCKHLKIYGPQLENSIYQGQLDKAFLVFREGMVRGILEYEARVHLLEMVELRECNWITRKNLSPVINHDYGDYTHLTSGQNGHILSSADSFCSEEVFKRPLKYREKSSKSASKGFCRNEVIIKNSDSGKVMGIKGRRVHMIEQLSETIISFQRVPPTAKERAVQITGPNEENISYATRLIENTIRNNASPVREFCGSESSCSSEDSFSGTLGCDDYGNYQTNYAKTEVVDQPYLYKHKVIVRNCQLTITGDDYNYVTVAKAILDNYFSKLRSSESPDNLCYNDDVFLEKSEDVKNSLSGNLTEISETGDFKSYTSDYFGTSNVIHSKNSTSHVKTNARNFSANHRVDSALLNPSDSSAAAIPLVTSHYEDFLNDFTHPVGTWDSVDVGSRNTYTKEFLMSCRLSDLSWKKPKNWEEITHKFPLLVKYDPGHFSLNREDEKL